MKKPNHVIVGSVLIILHVVGVAGYLIPATTELFLILTPANLIISALALAVYQEQNTARFFIVSGAIALAGYLIEVLGVKTGVIFGEYSYLTTLGFKVADVPLLIGINWIILVIGTSEVSARVFKGFAARATFAAMLMMLMDVLIEPVAIAYQYWEWEDSQVPIQNYMAWFAVALVFQLVYNKMIPNTKNSVAIYLIIAQMLYFGGLNIFKTIF